MATTKGTPTIDTVQVAETVTKDLVGYMDEADGLAYICDSTAVPPQFVFADNQTATGESTSVDVYLPGTIVRGTASAAIAKGAALAVTSGGKLVTATVDNVWCVGWARSAAGADGGILSFLFWPHVTNDISALEPDGQGA